jgi:hypothetical protein
MPKRLKKDARPKDTNQLAHHVVRLSTEGATDDSTSAPIPPKGLSEYMSALGSKGGKVSGARRRQNLSDSKRSEIALRAATVRWDKERAKKKRTK